MSLFLILFFVSGVLAETAPNTCRCDRYYNIRENNCDSNHGFNYQCNDNQQNNYCSCVCSQSPENWDYYIINWNVQENCNGDRCDLSEKITLNAPLSCGVSDYPNKKLEITFKDINDGPCYFQRNFTCGPIDCVIDLTVTNDILYGYHCENSDAYPYTIRMYSGDEQIGWDSTPGSTFLFRFGSAPIIPRYPCNITDVIITPYCAADGCRVGDKVKMNFTVKDSWKCPSLITMMQALLKEKIGYNPVEDSSSHTTGLSIFQASNLPSATSQSQPQPVPQSSCTMLVQNSTLISRWGSPAGKAFYSSNFTIAQIPDVCLGKKVNVSTASLYNATGIVGTKGGSFLGFTFVDAGCMITDAKIMPLCGTDGCNKNERIQLNITVKDMSKCLNVNKMRIKVENSVSQIPPGGTLCELDLNTTSIQQVPITRTYSSYYTITNIPENCYGKKLDAKTAFLYNGTSGSNLIYQKSGSFGDFNFVSTSGCNVINAQLTNNCTNNICRQGDRITLNITVSDITKCQLVHPVKMEIKVSTPENVGGNGINTLATYDSCTVYLTNMTNMIAQGLSYLANYTVIIPDECAGKTVTAKTASLYNMTSTGYSLISQKSGTFSSFIYFTEGLIPECKCTYQGISTTCNQCQRNLPGYYCKDNGTGYGQWVQDCREYPTGKTCCDAIPGYACNSQGKCSLTGDIKKCNEKSSSLSVCQTSALWYCYWDKPSGLTGENPQATFCKHCYDDTQKPDTCSDYDNQSACTSDRCLVSLNNCPSGASCSCSWKPLESKCVQAITSGSGNNNQGTNECCSCSVSYGTCDQGCQGQENSRVKTTTCSACPSSGSIQYQCTTMTSSTECVTCSTKQGRLPFFEPWQVLIVLSLLTIYYIFIIKKHKKEEK